MSADNRTVHTDALATLGTIIDDKQKRDAVHIAVIPAVAGERLQPGEGVVLRDGCAYEADGRYGDSDEWRPLGVVDPYLRHTVSAGQRFWLLLMPRVITSLRHVWTHPGLPDEAASAPAPARSASEAWLRKFCERDGMPAYEVVLGAACGMDGRYPMNDGHSVCLPEDIYGDREIPPEFWDHVEAVTGKRGLPRAEHFRCAC